MMDVTSQFLQTAVWDIRQTGLSQPPASMLQPLLSKAAWPQVGKHSQHLLAITRLGVPQLSGKVNMGREVDFYGLTRIPESRNLQNGRPGQAPVGEKKIFKEGNHALPLTLTLSKLLGR